jgi:hypothetical protein
VRRAVLLLVAVLFAAGTILFGIAYYDRYWRWRDCFNELGRCYDPVSQDVYLEQAGIVWGSFAAISLLAGVALLLRRRRR